MMVRTTFAELVQPLVLDQAFQRRLRRARRRATLHRWATAALIGLGQVGEVAAHASVPVPMPGTAPTRPSDR